MKIHVSLAATLAAAAFAYPAAAQQQQPAQEQAAQAPAGGAETQAAEAQSGTPPRATAADLVVGATVVGGDGKPVGTIEAIDGGGAVVTTGSARGRLNLDAFYKDDRGLLIGYSRAQFEDLSSGKSGQDTGGQ